jgi:hypothetical protein
MLEVQLLMVIASISYLQQMCLTELKRKREVIA